MSRWPGVITALVLAGLGCLVAGAVIYGHDRAQWSDGSIDTVTLQLQQVDKLIMGELFVIGGLCLIALIGCLVHLGQRRLAALVTGPAATRTSRPTTAAHPVDQPAGTGVDSA